MLFAINLVTALVILGLAAWWSFGRPARDQPYGLWLAVLVWDAALFLFVVLLASLNQAHAAEVEPIRGIARVVDGDTLAFEDGTRVRLRGVDTPELARLGRPAQPFAEEARDFLRTLVEGREIVCLPSGADRYGRVVGACSFPGADFDLAEVMIWMGYARACPASGGREYVGQESRITERLPPAPRWCAGGPRSETDG